MAPIRDEISSLHEPPIARAEEDDILRGTRTKTPRARSANGNIYTAHVDHLPEQANNAKEQKRLKKLQQPYTPCAKL